MTFESNHDIMMFVCKVDKKYNVGATFLLMMDFQNGSELMVE